ncbi:Peptidyl-prolyl cis-trans isomerase PASTICCINO1 [Morus notabilis]|uniref:Peptidyl-prolyl cis-trans isomerase PASTICCINO1 n=1 Tax=Morus notabilis TaxID=981085 RepID=W9R6L5_9ROSA|nr:Peptidyl-prolyl cis-trans isomerase PASTICCINO1 [Morus notabilis]
MEYSCNLHIYSFSSVLSQHSRPSSVPEGTHVQSEIELLGFETPKDWTDMNFQSIMDDAEKIRSTGNRLFKEGKYELARAKYDKALREFNHVNPQDDEEGKVFVDTRVLDANPAHVKALYRRDMAYMAAGDFEEAMTDFQMMIKVDKSSESDAKVALLKLTQKKLMIKVDESSKPDAKAALLKLTQKEQEVERKARKQFKGLFDKKPGEISDVGTEDGGGWTRAKEQQDEQVASDSNSSEESHEAVNDPRQESWFSHILAFWETIFRSWPAKMYHFVIIMREKNVIGQFVLHVMLLSYFDYFFLNLQSI